MKGKEMTPTIYQKRPVQHPDQKRLIKYLLVSLIAAWLTELIFGHPFSDKEIEI